MEIKDRGNTKSGTRRVLRGTQRAQRNDGTCLCLSTVNSAFKKGIYRFSDGSTTVRFGMISFLGRDRAKVSSRCSQLSSFLAVLEIS